MQFKAKLTDGAVTVGEARTSAAIITGAEPEGVPVFATIALVRAGPDSPQLVIASNLSHDIVALDTLMHMAHSAVMRPDSVITMTGPIIGHFCEPDT